MNISRVVTLSLALAVAVVALGYVNPSFAHKTGVKHNHGGGDEDPTPPPEVCTAAPPPCIVSVGKSLRPAAADYVTTGGTYTLMSARRFGELLGEIPEISTTADDLCAAFDVIIVEWSNPKIKNLTWERLEKYMACGGGIIFEDPRNVEALAPDVTTLEINFKSTDDQPIPITLVPVCVLTEGPPVNDVSCGSGGINLTVVNQHMIFNPGSSSPGATFVFLTLADGSVPDVIGIYGMFGSKGGGIVLTGPDNSFHGNLEPIPALSAEINAARANMHKLLHNEINWLLSL